MWSTRLWQSVGVTITKDLEPYEETKIRILNGEHTSLAYLGVLSGDNKFAEVMSDKAHLKHFKLLQSEETLKTLWKRSQ